MEGEAPPTEGGKAKRPMRRPVGKAKDRPIEVRVSLLVTMHHARVACDLLGIEPSNSLRATVAKIDAFQKARLGPLPPKRARKLRPKWVKHPWAPIKGGTRTLRCTKCSAEYQETEAVYERRFGLEPPRWYCRDPACRGSGVGKDLVVVDAPARGGPA